MQQEFEGEEDVIFADLAPAWQNSTKLGGLSGITVDSEQNAVNLFGTVHKIFNLTQNVQVNKFTTLQYNVVDLNITNDDTVGLCFYEYLPQDQGFRDRCHEARSIVHVRNASFGQLLNGENATFQYIGIFQESNMPSNAKASISKISIVQGENTDIYDENGKCKDKNANTNGTGVDIVCTCKEGYIASNGGKRQGPFDSCIRCIESDKCRFDGESCDSSSDCFANTCEAGFCKARVSLLLKWCISFVWGMK